MVTNPPGKQWQEEEEEHSARGARRGLPELSGTDLGQLVQHLHQKVLMCRSPRAKDEVIA